MMQVMQACYMLHQGLNPGVFGFGLQFSSYGINLNLEFEASVLHRSDKNQYVLVKLVNRTAYANIDNDVIFTQEKKFDTVGNINFHLDTTVN